MGIADSQHVSRVVKHGHPVHQIAMECLQVGNSLSGAQKLHKLQETVQTVHVNLDCDVVGVNACWTQATMHKCRHVGEGNCKQY